MENLNDLNVPHPQLRNPTSPARDKLFGVIKCQCFAVEVSEVVEVDENIGEILQPGTLIQILPDYRGDVCHFKIRNFTKWLEKYKTAIYKCKKSDYIMVKRELWPYLLAYKNDEGLLKLVENINNMEFDLDILKLGSEVRIRRPPGNIGKYYEFVVAYNGLMKEISNTGYYIGLHLKNDHAPLTSDLKHFSQYYRFEGIGIVVQIDWIMLNLYAEEERGSEPSLAPYNDVSSEVLSEIINYSPSHLEENENHNMHQTWQKDFLRPQTNEEIQKMIDEVLRLPEFQMETNFNFATKTGYNNNADGAMKMSETAFMSENECNKKNNDQNHIVMTSAINEQSPKIPCGSSSNYGVLEISESGDIPHKREHDVASTFLINEESKPTTEIDAVSSWENETNNNAFKTEFKNNGKKSETWAMPNNHLKLPNDLSKNTIDISATSDQLDQFLKFSSETTTYINDAKTKFSNNANEAVKMNETEVMPDEICQILPIVLVENEWNKKNNNENHDVLISPINEQPKKIFGISALAKTTFSSSSGDIPHKREHHILSTPLINEQSKHTIEIGYTSEQRDQIPENHDIPTPSIIKLLSAKFREQSPKTAVIEPFTKADGAMRNTEKTTCDFCSRKVEIGDGFTLRDCAHSFCTYCISSHVNKHMSKELVIRCPYKKGYNCSFSLKDGEIKDFRKTTIYKKIPVRRLIKVGNGVRKKRLNQSPANSCDTTLNYAAEIESVTNADGAVRNAEKTNCDYCNITVEIGDGIILRECIHSFCADCIRQHVYKNSNCSKILCPYKKDYECNFDLQDVEIKDLGGETIYNIIVENRLKEYMATEPNARSCLNKVCGNVWVSQRTIHQQNERCPKCNENFCLICYKAHEPDERHENKSTKTTISDKVKNKFSASRPQLGGNCDICHRTNIPADKYVRLNNCRHTICTNCILPMIKSETLNSGHGRCSVCKVHLDDFQIAAITGLEASIQSRNVNRKNQPEVAAPLELCNCRPSRGNCETTLKCNHIFCRTYIASIVREMFNSNGYAGCPRCLHKIDKNIIRDLVPGLIKEEIVEKCRICPERVQCYLINCQHGFCLNCISRLIMAQVFDPNKMSVICTVCNTQVRNDDISRYGGQEIFEGYKLKIENDAINRPQ